MSHAAEKLVQGIVVWFQSDQRRLSDARLPLASRSIFFTLKEFYLQYEILREEAGYIGADGVVLIRPAPFADLN